MRVVLWGANGAMGKLLQARLGEQVVGRVSLDGENGAAVSADRLPDCQPDMILDFSHHSSAPELIAYARKTGCPCVIGTTAHTPEEKALIEEAARELPIFYAGNVSLGIAVLCRLAKQAAAAFPEADIEIVEIHHNRKVDAPSGTAHMLFNAIREVRPNAKEHCGRAGEGRREPDEIGIQSLRMGSLTGIHEVHICTDNQMLTLRHESLNRGMLADGAVDAARFLLGKAPGLYNMNDMLEG